MARKAPGTYTSNDVHCTMDPPFAKARNQKTGSGSGMDGHNKAPFDQAQSMGNGAIPTRFFDTSMAARSAKGSSSAGASTPIGVTKRDVNERRFKNPK